MSEVATENIPRERQSLLTKYDIPIDHLDFKYVNSCKGVKELEKIIKILRSQEEGHYPDLQQAAEKRLENLDPSNRLLRVESKALTKDTLDPQYWRQIYDDIEKWSDECSQKEKDILSAKKSCSVAAEDNFPPVRRPPKKMDKKDISEEKKIERISSYDYSKWEKYDADAECLKMDLEVEKRQQESTSDLKTDNLSELELITKESSQLALSMSKSEKEMLANKEKEIGNEFYKSKDYKQAVKNYTKSIALFPTPFSYNNRAASFLNLELYEMAVSDTNEVLQLEPDNVKALYRRAQAFEKLSEFSKALSDLNCILKLEPNNNFAKSMKEKLKNKKSSAKPKSSSGSNAKRSKLTLEGHKENQVGSSSSLRSTSSGGRGEPIPGPSGVDTKRLVKPISESKTWNQDEAAKTKKGMMKIPVVEVERDESTLFDWRRYYTEGRSAKIEVASKFREKASREVRPTEANTDSSNKNISHTNNTGNTYHSPCTSPRDDTKPLKYDPSNFTHSWELLTRERAPQSEKTQLLRSIRPHLLQAVIGNKLEEEILSDFLLCLKNDFKLKTETPLIVEYLVSFARLERFNIIKTFLPNNIKQVIEELMESTNASASLRKLYM